MWKPTPLRVRLGARYRLGQNNMTDRMAAAVVAQAEPRLRQVIADERNRWADAIMTGLPFAGMAVVTCLGATYILSPKDTTGRVIAYAMSALFFGGGVWMAARSLKEPPKAPPPPGEEPGLVQDVISTFVDPASQQLAQDIVEEATPRVERIVEEERQLATDALHSALPWAAAAVLAALATTFFVPEKLPLAKFGGYSVAALATLLGIYHGSEVARGEDVKGAAA